MALNSGEIRVAGTGRIYKAPLGTTIPTTTTGTLDAAFADLGYAADGFTLKQDLKTTDINAWQTLEAVRVIANSLVRTFSFVLQQTNADTLSLAWGGATVTAGASGAYTLDLPPAGALAEYVFLIDWSDGDTTQRIVVPRGTLTSLPELKFTRAGAVDYSLEVRAVVPDGGGDSVQVVGVDSAISSGTSGGQG